MVEIVVTRSVMASLSLGGMMAGWRGVAPLSEELVPLSDGAALVGVRGLSGRGSR